MATVAQVDTKTGCGEEKAETRVLVTVLCDTSDTKCSAVCMGFNELVTCNCVLAKWTEYSGRSVVKLEDVPHLLHELSEEKIVKRSGALPIPDEHTRVGRAKYLMSLRPFECDLKPCSYSFDTGLCVYCTRCHPLSVEDKFGYVLGENWLYQLSLQDGDDAGAKAKAAEELANLEISMRILGVSYT